MRLDEGRSGSLLVLLVHRSLSVEFGSQLFVGAFSKRLFQKPARVAAFAAVEALRFDLRLTGGTDDNFDDCHAAPHLHGQLDETVSERLFGDAVSFAATFDLRLFDGIRLQEAVELVLFSPLPSVVVEIGFAVDGVPKWRRGAVGFGGAGVLKVSG